MLGEITDSFYRRAGRTDEGFDAISSLNYILVLPNPQDPPSCVHEVSISLPITLNVPRQLQDPPR